MSTAEMAVKGMMINIKLVDFVATVSFECHRVSPFSFRLVRRMECADLIVYRLTMAFDQSSKPILVTSAECICSLLIYILVNLTAVDIRHPTKLSR